MDPHSQPRFIRIHNLGKKNISVGTTGTGTFWVDKKIRKNRIRNPYSDSIFKLGTLTISTNGNCLRVPVPDWTCVIYHIIRSQYWKFGTESTLVNQVGINSDLSPIIHVALVAKDHFFHVRTRMLLYIADPVLDVVKRLLVTEKKFVI
jgi:hypothetical protein